MQRQFVLLPLLVLISACNSEPAKNGPDGVAKQVEAAASASARRVAETVALINQASP